MILTALAWFGLVCAAIPAVMYFRNARAYRPAPRPIGWGSRVCETRSSAKGQGEGLAVSVLIPARNEAGNIAAAIESARANRDIEVEVVVLDDDSDDDTAAIAARAGARVVNGAPLPRGWNGKQFACWQLARAARHEWLVFMDADVRLAPDALGRMRAFMETSGVDLASGVPRQVTGTFLERLLIPLIHWVLLGFLPMGRMRASTKPAYGAGCGQLFIARRTAYEQAGGHAAIRASRHDGVKLPRAFRLAGFKTDLFDATDLAICRMYRSAAEVWGGLTKNATEGIGAPATIVPFTVLWLAGQVLPFCLVWRDCNTRLIGLVTIPLILYPRIAAAVQFRQSWLGAVLHPLGILLLLANQWWALMRAWAGRSADWKGRPAVGAATAALMLGVSIAIAGPTASVVAPIRLKDQFHHERRIEFPRERPLVLTIADRHGHPQLTAWVEPLHERFGQKIDFEGVADVAGIPAPFRPLLRSMFRKELAHPVMLDWQGEVVQQFDYRPRVANLYIIDRDGKMIGRAEGAADTNGLAQVAAWIRLTLETP